MGKSAKKKVLPGPREAAGKAPRKASRKPKRSELVAVPVIEALSGATVLDRLFAVVEGRRDADPSVSHSARLLSRGAAKVAQKFGEEAVECLIEAVAGNHDALIAESADVLYHLLVLWVSAGVSADDVWAELTRREGISGIAEKASRPKPLVVPRGLRTTKIP
ncbi:phosphoribosyl-ATP diphosphatase [Rhodopila sp.]|uniref:phosphoribosyl-ATP diphosphatase n=1 Tax=Rhodopila sp. TaxID=2480087 RepID=UPI003D0F6443